MGFFSFLTSDRNESIAGGSHGEWWLVGPKESLKVTYYDGFGRFTTVSGETVNVLYWLARQNFPDHYLDDEDAFEIGVTLRHGNFYVDHLSNRYGYSECMDCLKRLINLDDMLMFQDFQQEINVGGVVASINEHLNEERLTQTRIPCDVELKIASSERNAVYEKLTEAKCCPYLGRYYS
ncbi:hypothetical protein [Vibrio sp. THAF190c]|uniref:hypothetical protein n=1 Tax=Vibrio sp. THAF190c TaxID=2587865 RepID=UPI0012693134|nr:hypothetical protein [Vibrio sp. THAF190c]QFT13310.1 hypothetical protein FIV04_25505 [Vibrio sp. THAF190c]